MSSSNFKLNEHLFDLKLREKKVPKDGHCLYWCVVLLGLCSDVQHLRDLVASYQVAYKNRTVLTVVEQSFDDYIKGIRNSAYADHPEIVAICETLGLDIIIHSTTSDEIIHICPITDEQNTSKLVNIIYGNNHYNLLVPIEDDSGDSDDEQEEEDTSNDAEIARMLASL